MATAGLLSTAGSGQWEPDASSCNICQRQIGQCRRHHCRICGLCVCNDCSPNRVKLDRVEKVQRACTLCLGFAQRVPEVRQRLVTVSDRLMSLSGKPPVLSAMCLEEASVLCEDAVLPLEQTLAVAKARVEQADAAAAEARREAESLRAFICKTTQRLQGLLGSKDNSRASGEEAVSSDAATEQCEAALDRLGQELERRASWGWTRTMQRATPRASITTDPANLMASTTSECSPMSHRGSGRSLEMDGEQEVATNCSVCCSRLGKRMLNPRHHCRICQKSVCATCSPSSLQLAGEKQPVRVCTPCAGNTPDFSMLAKMSDLTERLHAVIGASTPERKGNGSLQQLLEYLERALPTLEGLQRGGARRV